MVFKGVDVRDNLYKTIAVEQGILSSVESRSVQAGDGVFLSPGFIDMQVNGYLGIDYSGNDLDIAGIRKLIDQLARTGTLHHVPTIITNSEERIIRNLGIIADAVECDLQVRKAIAGIHVEGPFISAKDGPRGAHDAKFVRQPDIEEVRRWQEAARGLIRMITIAPEKRDAALFAEDVTKMGIQVSIGHCEPDPTQLEALVAAGAGLCTHLGNGSSPLLPRLKNHIWMQLADDRLTAGIISDGFHLPPYVLKSFYRTKGMEKLVLVSDAALLGGLEPGISKWGDIEVEICPDGHLKLAGTEMLAGAGHLLDWDLRIFMEATGATLGESLKGVTENPARVLGLAGYGQPFRVGDRADIIAFRLGKDRLEILDYYLG